MQIYFYLVILTCCDLLILLQIPSQSCLGCRVTRISCTGARAKGPQDTHTTSKQHHITSDHFLHLAGVSFPSTWEALFSRSLVSLENCEPSPFREGGNEGSAPFSSLKPSATIILEEGVFFFYSGIMEFKKVQCKFLQTIVRQWRRCREQQKEQPVVL